MRKADEKKNYALLNNEQKNTYTTLPEQRRQNMRQGGQGGAPQDQLDNKKLIVSIFRRNGLPVRLSYGNTKE